VFLLLNSYQPGHASGKALCIVSRYDKDMRKEKGIDDDGNDRVNVEGKKRH
jgi:hypothetical protein